MANFLNNGGSELIIGTVVLIYVLIRDRIDRRKKKYITIRIK